MRDLNATQLAEIAASTSKPLIIIEVAWNGNTKHRYADYTVPGYASARILELTGLDNVINISNNSTSQQVTIKLDDTNGTILNIMQIVDVHLKPVWVYQWFEALDVGNEFLLFKGYINSPLEWNEGDRTVSFTVLSQVDGQEVGFSPEEGHFTNLSPEMVGVAWPMTFGTVQGVRALRLTTLMDGVLLDGFGIADFTLPDYVNAQNAIANQTETTASAMYDILDTRCTYNCQVKTQRNTIRIGGGQYFPRGRIVIKIDGTYLVGQFIGDTNIFQLANIGINYEKNHPLYYFFRRIQEPETKLPAPGECVCTYDVKTSKIKHYPYPIVRIKSKAASSCTENELAKICWTGSVGFHSAGCSKPIEVKPGICTYSPATYTGEVGGDTAGYVYLGAGSNVDLVTGRAQKYIVNIMPGTVQSVWTHSVVNGTAFLVQIPTNFYTVGTMTFGPLTVVTIDIPIALSQINDTWQDDIYVHFKSDVGPNTVDIIEYLINNNCPGYTTDAASFAAVKTKLEGLPSSFTLYERKEVFQLLQEIAWQAACALYVIDNKFYIKYLPFRSSSVDDILKTDILLESLRIGHTATEDLITKMILEWKHSDSLNNPNKIVLRHNVRKYGTKKATHQFYIYNWLYPILKHGTFWLIRKANTWKKCIFNTALTKLNLETLDYIDINLPGVLANSAVRSIIEQATYDSENHSIAFECWTPVKSGEMSEYIFAYPNSAVETELFPTEEERIAGMMGSGNEFNQAVVGTLPDKGGRTNEPEKPAGGMSISGVKWPEKCPVGTHGIGYGRGSPPCYNNTEYPDSCEVDPTIPGCTGDAGDSNPGSDAGGSAEGGGGMSVTHPSEETGGEEPGPQTVDKDGTKRPDKNDDLTAEELLGDLSRQHPSELPTSPGDDVTCWYAVSILYVYPVGLVRPGAPPCGLCPDPKGPGIICTGPLEKTPEVYYFGSCGAAAGFQGAMRDYTHTPACTGDRHPYIVSSIFRKGGSRVIGECADECQGQNSGMIAFQPSENSEIKDGYGNDGWTNFSNWAGVGGYPDFM